MVSREIYHNTIIHYLLLKDNFLEPAEKQRLRSAQTPPSPRPVNIRKVVELPYQLHRVNRVELVEDLFTDITFLEAAAEAGRVADLAADLEEFSTCFPHKSRTHKIFRLVKEAILRDLNFLREHPVSLFQCLWNTCWWYDCPKARSFYESADGPWNDTETGLFTVLEKWRREKETLTPGFTWVRSLRPPAIMLGSPQVSVLHGHSGDWTRVLCSPDGKSIVSCNADRTIRIWDFQSGIEKCILTGHTSYVESIDISPDGSKLLSGGADGTFRIWDLNCAGELSVTNTYDTLNWVDCVAFSKHGDRFAVGVSDKISIWDASGDRLLLVLKGHTDTVRSIGFAPDGSWLVSGSDDNTIRIWNTATGEESAILKGHRDKIKSICVSPDGSRVASGSGDCTIRIWDAVNKTELYVLNGHSGGVECVAFSPDGQMIASGSEDHQIRKWDAENGNCLGVLSGHERSVTSVAFSPDSRTIISGSADRTIRLWNASSDSNPVSLIGHKDVICEE
jgi:hypothetical protein